jgi:hypothetical protein
MSKKLSDYIPIFADQGIDYVAAAPTAGVSAAGQEVIVSGSPHVMKLDHQMANDTYTAVVTAGTAGMGTLVVTAKTTTTVEVEGGANGEKVNLVVVGQLKGQS